MGKSLCTLLIFSLICAGCSMPIGSIKSSSGEDGYDSSPYSMWLVPRRQIYQIDERFLRKREVMTGTNNEQIYNGPDFQIFTVENGAVFEINPEDPSVEVFISGNRNLSTAFSDDVTNRAYYNFTRVGTHWVTVKIGTRNAEYSLEVNSPNNGNGIGGDGGIGIIWAE